MNKDKASPRKIYTRNGVVHTCWDGKFYGPVSGKTELTLTARIERIKSHPEGGVVVTQRKRPRGSVTETWYPVVVPVMPRGRKDV